MLLKQKAYITGNLHSYVSKEAREAIKRLEAHGFDKDLAFSIAESSLPEDVFFNLPENEEDDDGSE